MPPTSSESPANAFEIKSGAVSLPVLRLLNTDVDLIAAQLQEKIRQAPDFFRHAPMAIDLQELAEAECEVDFINLVRAMRELGLVPVGVTGGNIRHYQAAKAAELSQLAFARQEAAHQARPKPEPQPEEAKPEPEESKPQPEEATACRIVDQPVRSGQRIYAKGDLIVISQVSAGAELMADGNIHVYGVLRGRAMAGVQGNTGSRIFCQDLQAELVAIGGHYKVSENIDDSVRSAPVQIYLTDNVLIIEKI